MQSLFGWPSELNAQTRLPLWPGWLGAIALVAVNLLQVGLNWWILREAADETRPPSSASTGALRVAALVAANGLQTGLTWWVYRMTRPTEQICQSSG